MSWKSEFAIYLLYVISNPLIIGVIITFVDDTFLLITLDYLLFNQAFFFRFNAVKKF